jgi:hypothetical protein
MYTHCDGFQLINRDGDKCIGTIEVWEHDRHIYIQLGQLSGELMVTDRVLTKKHDYYDLHDLDKESEKAKERELVRDDRLEISEEINRMRMFPPKDRFGTSGRLDNESWNRIIDALTVEIEEEVKRRKKERKKKRKIETVYEGMDDFIDTITPNSNKKTLLNCEDDYIILFDSTDSIDTDITLYHRVIGELLHTSFYKIVLLEKHY